MHTLGRRLALIALAAALGCLSGSSVLADTKEDARKHFDNGTQMMELEDFSGATAEFKTSLSLYRTSSALFNLAMCQKAMHRYPEALDSFRALLSEFGNKLTEDTRKEVNENISLLSKIIAEVEIAVNVSGATVSIDGATVGTTPLPAPVRVGAGNRRISVSRPGYATAEQQIQVAAGSKELLRFDLQPEVSAAAVGTTAPGATPPAPTGYTQDNPDPEMTAVENALGRPMYREYTHYQRNPASRKMGFVEYEYRLMKKKRNKGIILSCVLTPVLLGIGTALQIVFQVKADERRDEPLLDYYDVEDRNNEADALETVGWVFFGLFATAGTATLIPGAINWGMGASKMGKLEPAYKQYVEGISPEPAGDPGAAPADGPPPEAPPVAPTARLELGLVPVFDQQGTPSGAGLALSF